MPWNECIFLSVRPKKLTSEYLTRRVAELNDTTEKNRERLVRSELAVIAAFCSRAKTELRLGNREHAREALHQARTAIREANQWLHDVVEGKDDLSHELLALENRVNEIDEAA